jgi:hypothetical protein
MKMVTKKTEAIPLGAYIEEVYQPLTPSTIVPLPQAISVDDFAIAALQSVDWNQIGMGVDQAAKLCWSMAEAMVRNKP